MFGLVLLSLRLSAAPVALPLLAQAEPAPVESEEEPAPAEAPAPEVAPAPVPPAAAAVAEAPRFGLSLIGGGARRLGPAPRQLGPRYGFEVGTRLGWTYARGGAFDLGVGVGFAYQRFRRVVSSAPMAAAGADFDTERSFSYYGFELVQTVALPLGFFRPYLGVGGGVVIGYFSTGEEELFPGEKRALRPALSALAGLDVETGRNQARVGLALSAAWLLRAPDLATAKGKVVPVFGDRVALHFTFLQPF